MDPQHLIGARRPLRPLHLLLPALLVLASYAPALVAGFVWDDRPLVVENVRVHDPGRISDLLTSSFWETDDRHDRFRSFFRPLVGLSYAADHALWGLRPAGFHATNLMLHLACCWLLFALVRSEGLGDWPALAAACLFAVHPVHVESVAWIAGRTDSLCAALFLCAFLVQRRGPGSSTTIAGSCALFALALFAKEMAATLPLLVALDRRLAGARTRAALAAAAPFVAVLAGYVAARHLLVGGMAEPLFSLGPAAWAATALFVLARDLTLLLLPVGLDAHYPYPPVESLLSPLVLLSAAMLAVAAFAATRLTGRPRALFWLLWIPVTLAPVLAFGRFGDVLLADRFLYLPSAGLCGLAAHGLARLAAGAGTGAARKLAVAAALVVLVLAGASFSRSRVWSDDLTLFGDMVRTSPESALVRANLGLALYRRGDADGAIAELETAVRLQPSYALAHNNLAVALELRFRRQEALEHYLTSLRLAPGQLEAAVNAAHLLARAGRSRQGEAMLRAVLQRRPDYVAGLYALATVLERGGRPAEALPLLERVIALDAAHADAHYLLGKIHRDAGRWPQAVAAMRRFLALRPEPPTPWTRAARRVILEARTRAAAVPVTNGAPAALSAAGTR